MKDPTWISLPDLKRLYERSKSQLRKIAFLASTTVCCYLLFQSPQFTTTALFKLGKGKVEQNIPFTNFLPTLDFMLPERDASASLVLLSKNILGRSITQLGLQAEVAPPLHSFIKRPVQAIFSELHIPLKKESPFRFKNLSYSGEKTKSFYIHPLSSQAYEILNLKKERICSGKLHEMISWEDIFLTLEAYPTQGSRQSLFLVHIYPLENAINTFHSYLSIKPSKKDPHVLSLNFTHPDPVLGALFLNTLMQVYQDFLKEENQLSADTQISYLAQKNKELSRKFDQEMDEQAAYLHKNLGGQGFISLAQEIEMLSPPKEAYLSQLFDVEFELARFELPLKVEAENLEKTSPPTNDLKNWEFDKIDLPSAKILYMNYTNQFDSLHADLKQLSYLREHLTRDAFNLSSIGNVLSDSVTAEMIRKASDLELQLKDTLTHSNKEHERLKETLQIQKTFLVSHLQQVEELKNIQLKLMQEKMSSLQHVIVERLKTEKKLLHHKLSELHSQMHDLPAKWCFENKFKFKNELTKEIMQGLAQVSESKQLASHLYQADAKPLDSASIPQKAAPPYLLLSTCGTFLLFYLLGSLYYYLKAIYQGFPVSLETLSSLGLTVAGSFSAMCDTSFLEITDSDYETLRSLTSFLYSQKHTQALVGGLFLGENYDYSSNLAYTLHTRGGRVILLNCDFDHIPTLQEIPGLWHYLSNLTDTLPIHSHPYFDTITFGHSLPPHAEIFTKQTFSSLIQDLKTRYDFILILSKAPLTSSHNRDLLQLVEVACVSFERESLDKLQIYRQKQKQCVTFVENAVKPFV